MLEESEMEKCPIRIKQSPPRKRQSISGNHKNPVSLVGLRLSGLELGVGLLQLGRCCRSTDWPNKEWVLTRHNLYVDHIITLLHFQLKLTDALSLAQNTNDKSGLLITIRKVKGVSCIWIKPILSYDFMAMVVMARCKAWPWLWIQQNFECLWHQTDEYNWFCVFLCSWPRNKQKAVPPPPHTHT